MQKYTQINSWQAKFFLSYTSNACIAKDSVEIFIYPIPVLSNHDILIGAVGQPSNTILS